MGVLESHLEGRVLRLTLNRPEKRNALNEELSRALLGAMEAADAAAAVGAIVLTGNGGAFCAGMDLREVLDAQVAARMAPLHERLFTMIGRMRKPVVAAIQGAAIAGGTGVAANAHIVIAADDAQFGLTEIRIGLWPVLIFPACALAMGERRTTELALMGRLFGAAEAKDFGLVTEIVPDPLARATALAEALAAWSPEAMREGLAYISRIRGMAWDQSGAVGLDVRGRMMAGADFTEGVTAFLEKRRAVWPSLA
ncbi:MAG: enoyl-CoA hydratase/isomerase family protein [Acidobacteriia bacterium]|nr:enoyl-CoA hydratase/isomerase family protein [Terriglobia bacterium]